MQDIFKTYHSVTADIYTLDSEESDIVTKSHKFKYQKLEKSLLGRKTKINLRNLRTLCKMYTYTIPSEYQISVPIATTSKALISKFGNQRAVSRVLELAQEVGLLYCNDKTYTYRSATTIDKNQATKSKYYIFNRAMMDDILNDEYSYSDENKEEKTIFKKFALPYNRYISTSSSSIYNNSYSNDNDNVKSIYDGSIIPVVDVFADEAIYGLEGVREYKFSSKQRIISNKITDEMVIDGLSKHYPQLSFLEDLLKYCNAKEPDNLHMRAIPSIRRVNSKDKKTGKMVERITKIGIRATSQACNTTTGKDRSKILQDYLGDKVYNFDIKSSIYRVNYLLDTGIWKKDDFDFYAEMGCDFSEDRDIQKAWAMKVYFTNSVDKIYANELFTWMDQIRKKSKVPRGKESEVARQKRLYDLGEAKRKLEFLKKPEVEADMKSMLKKYFYKMREIVTPVDSEIFLHESCILAMIHKELLDMGCKVVQVYDGFYFDKDIDVAKIAEKCAIAYYDSFIKKFALPYNRYISTSSPSIPYSSNTNDKLIDNNDNIYSIIPVVDVFAVDGDKVDFKLEDLPF